MQVAIVLCTALAILSFMAAPAFLGLYLSNRILRHVTYPRAHTWADGLAKSEFPATFFEENGFEEFRLCVPEIPGKSAGASLTLKGMWKEGSGASRDRSIVFLHGVSWTLHGDIKYADEFLRRGWNVVMIDLRAHGDSEGSQITFGYRERHDVVALLAAVRERFPATRILGVHGESMGAAIGLQALPLLKSVDFLVADSSFSDLAVLSRIHLGKFGVPRILYGVVEAWCALFTWTRAGFRFTQVSPIRALAATRVPVMFIHGCKDEVTPCVMSQEMHALREKQGVVTSLHLQPEALHTQAVILDKSRYMKAMWTFIDALVPPGES